MPACSGAPDVMGIHNTHTYLHPPHPWTLETHTHTHSLWSTRALVQMAPPCVDSVGSYWVTEDICYADEGGGGAPSACECVCVCVCVCERVWTALRSKVIHYLNEALAVLQGDGVIIIKSGVARRTPAAASFIRPHRVLSPWADTDNIPPIFHSPALSFTLLDCATLSVNICLWRFVDVGRVRQWRGSHRHGKPWNLWKMWGLEELGRDFELV